MNGCRPCHAWVSEPQTPAATIRTVASPGAGTGTSTRCTSTWWSAVTTTRRIVGVAMAGP